jgi:hypothetical protein
MFLWVLMCICVSVYFLKKSQPKHYSIGHGALGNRYSMLAAFLYIRTFSKALFNGQSATDFKLNALFPNIRVFSHGQCKKTLRRN